MGGLGWASFSLDTKLEPSGVGSGLFSPWDGVAEMTPEALPCSPVRRWDRSSLPLAPSKGQVRKDGL